MELLIFLLGSIGVTLIITSGDIFNPLRSFLNNGKEGLYQNFFGLLITCPQCVGFWIGVCVSSLIYSPFLAISDTETIFIQILATIFDGGIVSFMAYFSNVYLNYLISKKDQADIDFLYKEYDMKKEEENKLEQQVKKELLTD